MNAHVMQKLNKMYFKLFETHKTRTPERQENRCML